MDSRGKAGSPSARRSRSAIMFARVSVGPRWSTPIASCRPTKSAARVRLARKRRRFHSSSALQFTAQVTENVFDSPTGRFLLIPQGTQLIGIYDSQVAFGQSRVLLVWTRLIMPNGRSIVLDRQPGADTAGYAGPEDEVDNHWGALFKAALSSTLLGVGSDLANTTGTAGHR